MKKIIALALGATIAASAASAGNGGYIGLTSQQDAASIVNMDVVVSETSGKLAIYDFRAGKIGAKLGESVVTKGANTDLKVNVGSNLQGDVMAVLMNNQGKQIDTRRVDIRK
jgi:hypothetical protein